MIIVKNRELLIPENERYLGTTQDHASDNRMFRLERFSQAGEDLSALTYHLDLKYPDERTVYTFTTDTNHTGGNVVVITRKFVASYSAAGTYTFSWDGSDWKKDNASVGLEDIGLVINFTPASGDTITVTSAIANVTADTVLLTKEVTDDYINLTWLITAAQLVIPGTVYIALRGSDENGTVRWASYNAAMYVDQNLYQPVLYDGNLSELEQLEEAIGSGLRKIEYLYTRYEDLDTAAGNAEAYAVGTRDGVEVEAVDDAYQNNAKYYRQISERYAKGTENGTSVSAGIGFQDNAKYYSEQADIIGEKWATGTENGVEVGSADITYHNNAKYYAEQADISGEKWTRGTANGVAVGSEDETYHNNAKYYAEQSDGYSNISERYAKGTEDGVAVSSGTGYHDNAKHYSEQADLIGEKWARGTADGVAVDAADETYHNNAKYYSEQADISGEKWARGTVDGVAVDSTDETHNNNAKYYSEVAEAEKDLAQQYGSGLKDQADANTANIINLGERIAEVAQATAGSEATEIADARVAAVTQNSKVYQLLGDAIRGQVDYLQGEIDQIGIFENLNLGEWEDGGLDSSDGSEITGAAIRTGYIEVPTGYVSVKLPYTYTANLKCLFYETESDTTYDDDYTVTVTNLVGAQVLPVPAGYFMRLALYPDMDASEITAAEGENVTAKLLVSTKTSMGALNTSLLQEAETRANETAELTTQVTSAGTRLDGIDNSLLGFVDGGYVENGVAYFTNNGSVLFEITGVGGSGGGGGSAIIGAALSVTNTTGWLSKTISTGADCEVSFTWSSIEDEMPTGSGTLRVTVNNVIRANVNIAQGNVSLNIGEYLDAGSNVVKVRISDVYGQYREISFSITVIALSISSSFDVTTPFTDAITFPYTPVGAVSKTVHFLLDGTEIGTRVTSVSGSQLTYTIPAQSHGGHVLRAYLEAEVNGDVVRSNELYYEFIAIEPNTNRVIIVSSFDRSTAQQYASVVIPYRVYNPRSDTAVVNLYINDELVSTQSVDRTEQSYTYRANTPGTVNFKITSGTASKTVTFTVTASEIDVQAVAENLALYLNAQGRSNNEESRENWSFEEISAQFSGFGYRIDGWQKDDDGIDVLRVQGNARVEIPYQMFGTDFKAAGKTIEIEFATHSVTDYNAEIITCYANDIGIKITPQMVTFKGAQSEISTLYKDNEHVRLSIVVEKQTENRLILVYINGIMSRAIQYASGERFSQLSPVGISIGSDECGVDIYAIRVYDNNLTRKQVLDNWIADTQVGTTLIERYSHNDIYDAYGNITVATLPSDLPYFVLEGPELPQYKGDTKTISGTYTDPVYPSRSFSFTGCRINVQGTSSAIYYRKNYDMQFREGFVTNTGTLENYPLRPGAIPFNRYVLKADVASSESTNNTGLVRFYNDICPYKTPEMLEDERVRWGIDGIPIAVFWHNTDDGTTQFLGKYNFNLPKRAPEPYGYSGNLESWEVERNNSSNVKFQDNDFTSLSWDEVNQAYYPTWYDDFEARFPSDAWRDYAALNEFITWVLSTWRDGATNENLASPAVFRLNSTITVNDYASDTSYTVTDEVEDGVATGYKIFTFTKDTPAYRLTKFRAELADYAEVDSLVFYYIFTGLFLMIDSRAKNLFIGFNGSEINDQNRAMTRKMVAQPYDMDTGLGTNNSGVLMFGYSLEDTDHVSSIISGVEGGGSNAPVFNAQDSVLWTNLRDSFRAEITQMYRNLRANGTLSYNAIETLYEEHQAKWPEAMFNEDAYIKYLVPLTDPVTVDEATGQLIRTDRYLTMLQGSKAEQRKWWLWNRFRYMDSKYVTGDASNTINLRLFASGTLVLTPATDLYVGVSFGGGTTVSLQRTTANTSVRFPYVTPSGVTEMETWIYSADLITDVGDLSVFYPNELDFSKATRLRRLKIGSSAAGYANANLRALDVRNSALLEHIDVRNCPNLTITVNLEGSPRLTEAFFDGTAVTGVDFADGGALVTLHLPATITTLTLLNLTELEELVCPSFANVTRLMLANMDPTVVNPITLMRAMQANSQVNIQGLYMETTGTSEIDSLMDLLDTMSGVSRERGTNGEWIYTSYDKAQISGEIHTDTLTGAQIAAYNERYPYLRVTADSVTSVLTLKTWDGGSTVATINCINGVPQTALPTVPARSSTAQYSFTAVGWALDMDESVNDPDCTVDIYADTTVYAAYSRTVRTYTITWKNEGGAVLETDTNVPYGATPSYDGATPTYGGQTAIGWTPAVTTVTGDTTYTAYYTPKYNVYFYNGSTLLQTVQVNSGSNATYTGETPTNAEQTAFLGWSRAAGATAADSAALQNITANTNVYAVFASAVVVEEITDSWADIVAAVNNGTYASKYKVGNYKPLDLGAEGTVNMQIAAINADAKADGTGNAALSFVSKELLTTSKRWNPSLVTNYAYPDVPSWTGNASNVWTSQNRYNVSDAEATWTITATSAGTLTIKYKTSNGTASYNKLAITVNGTAVETAYASTTEGTYTVECAAGDVVTVYAKYSLLNASYDYYGTVTLSGTGTISVSAEVEDAPNRVVDSYGAGTGSIGGWENCELRTYYKNALKPLIPETVRNAIVEVTKYSRIYDTSGGSVKNVTSTEDVWAPSMYEIGFSGSTYESMGARYNTLFDSNAARIKYKVGASSAASWWSRSATGTNTISYVYPSGSNGTYGANTARALALGFCL